MEKGQTIVKAIFKGQDGSCGFKTGREYTLQITHEIKRYLSIESINPPQSIGLETHYCDYSSVISFLDNWDNIRKV